MAFVSMVLVFIAAILLILAAIGLIGLILLIVGIVKKRNPKNKGKKHPVVLIVIGSILMVPFVGTILCILIVPGASEAMKQARMAKYDSVPEIWQNERVLESQASSQAIEALISAAEAGDRDEFAENFTETFRDRRGFDKDVDDFLDNYPGGIDISKFERHGGGSGASYNHGHNVCNASCSYEGDIDGEHYYIYLSFCYENTDSPEDVGVTYFTIMNVEGQAEFNELRRHDYGYELEDDGTNYCLQCSIKSPDEVNARMINGSPYVWKDSTGPMLSEDEMRDALEDYIDLYDAIRDGVLGEPNITIKYKNSTGYDHYYELKPEDGEPRYAHVNTSSEWGRIIDVYLNTPTREIYDNPIVEFRKAN